MFALTGPMTNANAKVCVCMCLCCFLMYLFVCILRYVCESKGGLCQQGSHLLCEHLKALLIAALSALCSVPVAYPANNIFYVFVCGVTPFPLGVIMRLHLNSINSEQKKQRRGGACKIDHDLLT